MDIFVEDASQEFKQELGGLFKELEDVKTDLKDVRKNQLGWGALAALTSAIIIAGFGFAAYILATDPNIMALSHASYASASTVLTVKYARRLAEARHEKSSLKDEKNDIENAINELFEEGVEDGSIDKKKLANKTNKNGLKALKKAYKKSKNGDSFSQ